MRIQRPDQAEVANTRPVAKQKRMIFKMPVEIIQKSLIAFFYFADIAATPSHDRLVKGSKQHRHRQPADRSQPTWPGRFDNVAEIFEHVAQVLPLEMPAIVHRRQHQPFVAVNFEQQRNQPLPRPVLVHRPFGIAALEVVDNLGRVLHEFAIGCHDHRYHPAPDMLFYEFAVHRCRALDEWNLLVPQVGARLPRIKREFVADQSNRRVRGLW